MISYYLSTKPKRPAPGGQNTDWHSDHGTHIASFWLHKDFQDRVIWLWQELAKHYRDNTWIAGYNPLNEPTDPSHTRVVRFYDRICNAIRAVDPHHTIFFDGNTFASDFSHFGESHKKWSNTAYSIHDYSLFGFPNSSELYIGTEQQQRRLRRSYEKKREWMDERGLCVWNGEWGPVYARREYDGDKTDEINEVRYRVLKDQLGIYNKVCPGVSVGSCAIRSNIHRTVLAGLFGCTKISVSKGWYMSRKTRHTEHCSKIFSPRNIG
jgi:hypothetical protein